YDPIGRNFRSKPIRSSARVKMCVPLLGTVLTMIREASIWHQSRALTEAVDVEPFLSIFCRDKRSHDAVVRWSRLRPSRRQSQQWKSRHGTEQLPGILAPCADA